MKTTNKKTVGYNGLIRTSRMIELSSLSISTSDQLAAYAISLEDFPSYTNLTNAFDEYRILNVTFHFVSGQSRSYWDGTTSVGMPSLLTATDFDDAATPASKDKVLADSTCRIHDLSKVVSRSFKPKVSQNYWQNSLATGFGSAVDRWIDCSSPGVEHFGLKCCLSPDASTANHGNKVRVFATADIEFRSTV